MSQELEGSGFLTPAESETLLRRAEQTPRPSLLLAPEDIRTGDRIAVHSLRRDPAETVPIMGQAGDVQAVNLPFVVVTLRGDADRSPITLDVRFLNFMRVTEKFARAQTVPPKAADHPPRARDGEE